jgi:hypothetical protein
LTRFVAKVGLVGLALTFISTASLIWAQPALAALACPPCFGFERLQNSVFVEPSMTHAERTRFAEIVAEGEARATRYLGALRQQPVILACASPECSRRMHDKGARAVSYAQFGLRTAPRSLDAVTVAHELTHIEVHGRLGLVRFLSSALPAWFDEGLAVLASDDPQYLLPKGLGDRCRAEPSGELSCGMGEWMRRASVEPGLYAKASCRVLRWGDAHGGRDALLALVDRVSAGEHFETAWGHASKQ